MSIFRRISARLFLLTLNPGLFQAPAVEIKLLVWYDLKDPGMTFRSQVYDLRKKPIDDKAVSAWMVKTRKDFPDYRLKLVDVRLSDWPGASDSERLLQAIQHEVGEAYPPIRVLERSKSSMNSASSSPLKDRRLPRPAPDRVPGIGSGNPTGDSSSPPFPIPYPKPHP